MGPDTFQNSPFTQGGYNLGNQNFQNQQQNQQLQEQNYLQQVKDRLWEPKAIINKQPNKLKTINNQAKVSQILTKTLLPPTLL